MSSRKRTRPSEKDIDALVEQDAKTEDAWDPPIAVPASRSPRLSWMRSAHHLELAAKFYVLSVLHRLGGEANLTFENRGNVDITVVGESGQPLTIDVKMLRGTKQWPVEQLSARDNHFVVFVCFPEKAQKPEATPELYAVHSERLNQVLRTMSSKTLNVDLIQQHSGKRDTWRQIVPESVA